jgi:hypothetical protein
MHDKDDIIGVNSPDEGIRVSSWLCCCLVEALLR